MVMYEGEYVDVLCVRRKYQRGLYLNYDVDEFNFHLWLVFLAPSLRYFYIKRKGLKI